MYRGIIFGGQTEFLFKILEALHRFPGKVASSRAATQRSRRIVLEQNKRPETVLGSAQTELEMTVTENMYDAPVVVRIRR